MLRSRWTLLPTIFVLALVFAQLTAAQTLTTLYNFTGGTDGAAPFSGLVATGGKLYGTAGFGGIQGENCNSNAAYGPGCGTVFELTPTASGWSFSGLYSFTGGEDGDAPFGTLASDGQGNLYGTASWGGTQNANCSNNDGNGTGCGTIYKLARSSQAWTFSVIYNFSGIPDGANPDFESLVLDKDGNAYGTTEFGGNCCDQGGGTVFKVTADGTEKTLYRFGASQTDGQLPYGGVVADKGNLYGTTYWGGSEGYGTVFELTKEGTEFTVHNFASGNDGGFPYAGLVRGENDVLYGTTYYGGPTGNGTAFEITPDGAETVIHSFCSSPYCADGRSPYGALIAGTEGNFYGTTYIGGTNGYGIIFVLSLTEGKWVESVLHDFDYSDGAWPYGRLLLKGNVLYGTTVGGGTDGHGTVFALTLPSSPGK